MCLRLSIPLDNGGPLGSDLDSDSASSADDTTTVRQGGITEAYEVDLRDRLAATHANLEAPVAVRDGAADDSGLERQGRTSPTTWSSTVSIGR